MPRKPAISVLRAPALELVQPLPRSKHRSKDSVESADHHAAAKPAAALLPHLNFKIGRGTLAVEGNANFIKVPSCFPPPSPHPLAYMSVPEPVVAGNLAAFDRMSGE